MRKAVAQVASKARGTSSKRSRDDNPSTPPKATSPPKSSRGKDAPVAVKSHTKMTPDEAALAAKNYRLAKELSELRVRHREESKTVTKLTMENMTLASKCREVMQEAALYKKKFERQRAAMIELQRQHSNVTPTSEEKAVPERAPVVSPVLVSSDDFEEDICESSKSMESEKTPVAPISPLPRIPTAPSVVERSPTKSPVVQATINPHRFFPQSASPKIARTGYNEEFPGDITAATPSRRINFQRMGSFEELESEDDIDVDTTSPSPARDGSRDGMKAKSQNRVTMSSLDAFEASFQTDIARTFSSSDSAPSSDEIYDPFSNSPVKMKISAASPILEKPYQAESPPPSPPPRRGALVSDPPGTDKTSTRSSGHLHKTANSEDKATTKSVSPPSRAKTASLQSVDLVSPNIASTKRKEVISPNRVKSDPVSKVAQPELPEQSKSISPRLSLSEQVLTVQSKAALLLLSDPEGPKKDEEVSVQLDNAALPEKSTLESSKISKQGVSVQSKAVTPRESSPEAPRENLESNLTSTVKATSPSLDVNQQGASEEAKVMTTEKPVVPTANSIDSSTLCAKPSVSTEKSPRRAQKKVIHAASPETSPTTERSSATKLASSNEASEKSPSSVKMPLDDKIAPVPSMLASSSISHLSPSPSIGRKARVTPSPGLVQSSVSEESQIACSQSAESESPVTEGSRDVEKPRPIPTSTKVDDQTRSPAQSFKRDNVSVPPFREAESYSARRFANQVETPEKNSVVNSPQSPPWAKGKSFPQDGSVQRSHLKINGGGSIFPKTSPSSQTPILIKDSESPGVKDSYISNGNDSASSIRGRESGFRGASSPFRKTFGDIRPAWAHNETSDVKTASPSTPVTVTPTASTRSWQKSSNESRPSWSHDRQSSRVDSGSASKTETDSRPWQTGVPKSSLAQQDRSSDVISSIVARHAKAASRSNTNRNGYSDQRQHFKPSMSIKELAAAFESRSPEKSFTTYSDASTPSDEGIGEIPMVSPSRVDEVRKSLNSQFGQ